MKKRYLQPEILHTPYYFEEIMGDYEVPSDPEDEISKYEEDPNNPDPNP